MSDQNKLLNALDEEEKKASGGGGFIGKLLLQLGYKLFVTGLDNRASFFEYAPGDKDSQKAALERAKAIAHQHGITKAPQSAFQIVVFRETVKGREVGWKDDRFFVTPLWTDGYKKVVRPALAEAGVSALGEMWGRVSFVADPTGRTRIDTTDLDDEGQPTVKPELVAFVAEVYANEKAAIEAAGDSDAKAPADSNGSNGSVPSGWKPAAWDSVKPEILKALAGGKSMPDVAKDYGVEVQYIAQVKA